MKAIRHQQPLDCFPSSLVRTPRRHAIRTVYASLAMAVSCGIAGCGGSGPEFHAVVGSVQLTDGETKVLAGHGIEAMLESDNQVRANGTIAADGQFSLETLHEGVVRRGAPAGRYQARIVLSDDDSETRRLAAAALPKKAFQFDSSGLAFEVPAASAVQLRISK